MNSVLKVSCRPESDSRAARSGGHGRSRLAEAGRYHPLVMSKPSFSASSPLSNALLRGAARQ